MSAFVNYALTLGQQIAPSFGYASLGQPLEQFGINEVGADVPGAVPMTAAEQAFYNCGDLTPQTWRRAIRPHRVIPATDCPRHRMPSLYL